MKKEKAEPDNAGIGLSYIESAILSDDKHHAAGEGIIG